MLNNSQLGPSGSLAIKVVPGLPARTLTLKEMIHFGMPSLATDKVVNAWRRKNLPNFYRGFWRIAAARALNIPHFYGQLHLRVFRSSGEVENLGVASLRVVTDAGVAYLVDAFQGLGGAEPELFKYHGFGSGAAAESAGNTALTTEFTTPYVGDIRPTGSQTEPGGTPNVYRTIATFSPESAVTCAEHGLFSAVSGPTLWDRSTFTGVGLGIGDSLQATYDCTFASGS